MPADPKEPRVFKLPEFLPSAVNDGEVANDFLDVNSDEFLSSTPKKRNDDEIVEVDALKRKSDETLEGEIQKRTSLDSDLMNDDESVAGDQASSGPTTAESNTKSNTEENLWCSCVRVSRDSGITSPEPVDELLTITLTEPSQTRRESSDTNDTFNTADAAELSQHDQEIVNQAQQKYQEQVSEMQNLVQKVNRWHTYLKPILQKARQQGHFEMHEYGTRVLEAFPSTANTAEISFADVMHDKPDDSVARYFLSSLMLVNTGNIELTVLNTDPNKVSEHDELRLKLKSRVRLHESLENMDETVPALNSNGKRSATGQLNGSKHKRYKS